MKQDPIDAPKPSISPFQLVTIGFLLGSSFGLLDWIMYRTMLDLFILMENVPLYSLWLANILTTLLHATVLLIIYRSIRKKLTSHTLNFGKLYDHSKYFLSATILINIFFLVYWDTFLPPSFFDALVFYESFASESLIFIILPFIFTLIYVFFGLVLLKRLSDKSERSERESGK